MNEIRTGLNLADVLRGQTSPHLASVMYLNDMQVIDPFQDAAPCFLSYTQKELDCGLYGFTNRYSIIL